MTIVPRITCEPAATVAETAQTGLQTRKVLRQCLLDARLAIEPAARCGRDHAIVAQLKAWLTLNWPSWREAGAITSSSLHPASAVVLGVYWAIRDEPDLRPFYDELAAAGVSLALPVVTAPDAPLQFARWDPGAVLMLDRFGIATPQTIIAVDPAALLIPCVGFNATRHRLGYGGGFYDRTLAIRQPRPLAIGIATADAACDFIAATHDMPMDVVITEAGPA